MSSANSRPSLFFTNAVCELMLIELTGPAMSVECRDLQKCVHKQRWKLEMGGVLDPKKIVWRIFVHSDDDRDM